MLIMAPTQHTDADESKIFDPDPYFQSFSEEPKEEVPLTNGDESITEDSAEQTEAEVSSEHDLPIADVSGSWEVYNGGSGETEGESSSKVTSRTVQGTPLIEKHRIRLTIAQAFIEVSRWLH